MASISQSPFPQIFIQDGSAISIHVRPDIPNQAHFVRDLKRRGASLAPNIRNATYAIVNQHTDDGRRHMRDFGRIVCLQPEWVSQSVKAGRILTGDDNWGGCLATDDGVPLSPFTGETDDLPTPRATPLQSSMASQPIQAAVRASSLASSSTLPTSPRLEPPPRTVNPLGITNNTSVQMNLAQSIPMDILEAVYLERKQSEDTKTKTSSRSSPKGKSKAISEPIFANKTFYIQPEINNRKALLKLVQANGGTLVTGVQEGYYTVLSSRHSSYSVLCAIRLQAPGPGCIVRPDFIEDSVEQGELLDEDAYAIPIPPKVAARIARAGVKREAESDPEAAPAPSKKKKVKAVVASSLPAKTRGPMPSKSVAKERKPVTTSRPTSPVPPPPESRVLRGPGRYGFPEVECQYVMTYIPILLQRNVNMTSSEIAQQLHTKMPHHSPGSWKETMRLKWSNEIASMVKNARIAHNKAESAAKGAGRSNIVDEASHPKIPKAKNKIEEGIARLTEFFSVGPGGMREPDAKAEDVWELLSQQDPHGNPAKYWEDFYGVHHQEVQARLDELSEEE